jgi:transcriptional regulator with XRE-family HTH domain
MEEVGNKIREIRKQAGMSMKELAGAVGLSYLTIQRIETGEVSPSVAVLSEIAYCLKRPITSFFDKTVGVQLIKSSDQPEIESSTLLLKLLVPKGVINDKISISLGKAEKGKCIDAHSNDGLEITYMLKGSCRFIYETQAHEMKAGDIVYFDAKRPHEIEALEPIEFINFYLRQVP